MKVRGKFVTQNHNVPKAAMVSKRISVREQVTLQSTAWIPKAEINKPMPLLNLTLSIGQDSSRITAFQTDELIICLEQVIEFLKEHSETMENTLLSEIETWNAIHQAKKQALEEIREAKRNKSGKTVKLNPKTA